MSIKSFDADEIQNLYFEYLYCLCGLDIYDKDYELSKRKFAKKLYDVEFVQHEDSDENYSVNGMALRYTFMMSFRDAYFSELDFEEFKGECEKAFKNKNCSMLEVMVSLADKMEDIMSDPVYPDRKYQWFNKMIVSLGLSGYTEKYLKDHPDWEKTVEDACKRLFERKYESNGKGGLFYIISPDPADVPDMRTMTLWQQACAYLNKVTD